MLHDERLAQKVGAVVLLLIAAAIAFVVFVYDQLEWGERVRIDVQFAQSGGLREGAPLVVAGVGVAEAAFRQLDADAVFTVRWGDGARCEAGETVAGIVDFYRESTEHSRRIVSTTASLDDISAGVSPFYGHVSLRWILVHMLEETARHAGHLDLMREQIDGQTGD